MENAVYSQEVMSQVPWMMENEARAQKWSILTGYQSAVKPGQVQEEHGVHARLGLEMMLENHVAWLSSHQGLSHMGKRLLRMKPEDIQEAIDTANVEPFVTFSMPIIRRLYPALYAQSLVTVWPTPIPEAKIFYLNFQYGNTKVPTTANDRIDLLANIDRAYAGWGHNFNEFAGDGSTTAFTLASGSVKTTSTAGAYSSAAARVWVDGVEQTHTTDFTVDNAGAGGLGRIVFSVAPANGTVIVARYSTYEEGDTPRDIDMDMTSDSIKASDMALRTGWSVQSEQDMLAYHGLSVEGELTGALSLELLGEVDLNILHMLLHWTSMSGSGNVNWDSSGYLPGDQSTLERRAYDATLGDAIDQADDLIWAGTKGRARSSFMVCGTAAAQRLRKINSFKAFTGGDGSGVLANNTASLERRAAIGTLDGSKTVFKDPRFPTNKILLGYKGTTPFHMGAVWAPYRLFFFTPRLPDPNANFQFKKGVLSRAAQKVITPEMYATVTIT